MRKKSNYRRKSPKKKSKQSSPKKSADKTSAEILRKISAKYNLQTYASGRPIPPQRLAERLNLYAASTLTRTEKQKILPYLKNQKSKRKSPNKKSKRKSPNKKYKRKSPNKKSQQKTAASQCSEIINTINSIEQDGMIITQYEIIRPSGTYQFFSFNSPDQKVDSAGRPYIIAVDGNVIPIGSKNIVYAGENADFARIHQMVLQHYQQVAMRMAGQRLPNPGDAPLSRVNALSLNESKAEDLVARAQRHEKGYYYQP